MALVYLYCFKPYYKWITFNTILPVTILSPTLKGFKPYYKWITFNTSNHTLGLDQINEF